MTYGYSIIDNLVVVGEFYWYRSTLWVEEQEDNYIDIVMYRFMILQSHKLKHNRKKK